MKKERSRVLSGESRLGLVDSTVEANTHTRARTVTLHYLANTVFVVVFCSKPKRGGMILSKMGRRSNFSLSFYHLPGNLLV
jgi:hypothetical protein